MSHTVHEPNHAGVCIFCGEDVGKDTPNTPKTPTPIVSDVDELREVSVIMKDILPFAVYGRSWDMLEPDELSKIAVAHVEMCKLITAYTHDRETEAYQKGYIDGGIAQLNQPDKENTL